MIGAEIGKAIEVAAPQIGIPVLLLKIGAGLAVLALAGWILWRAFFAPGQAEAKHDQVQIKATQGMGQAAVQSGREAIQITVDNGKAAAGIDAAVKGALNEIAKAKGADTAVDDAVDDVGRRAICVRSSAAGLPECQSLQRPGP